MAKLETSFKDNDYAYVFEVMYAPVVEGWAAKSKVFWPPRPSSLECSSNKW